MFIGSGPTEAAHSKRQWWKHTTPTCGGRTAPMSIQPTEHTNIAPPHQQRVRANVLQHHALRIRQRGVAPSQHLSSDAWRLGMHGRQQQLGRVSRLQGARSGLPRQTTFPFISSFHRATANDSPTHSLCGCTSEQSRPPVVCVSCHPNQPPILFTSTHPSTWCCGPARASAAAPAGPAGSGPRRPPASRAPAQTPRQ